MRNNIFATSMSLLIASTGASFAAPITTLFNTGVDATGTPLANNAPEIHYSLVSVPAGGVTGVRVATAANGAPIGPWKGDNTTSAWIGPNSDAQLDGPVGTYDFQTTFTLNSSNFPGAAITGQWLTDNSGTDILLNGVSTGQTAVNTVPNDYSTTSPFSLTNGFVLGLNTIDFIVANFDTGGGLPNPVGLRVEFGAPNVDGNAAAAPEPGSVALFATALLGLGLIRRLRA